VSLPCQCLCGVKAYAAARSCNQDYFTHGISFKLTNAIALFLLYSVILFSPLSRCKDTKQNTGTFLNIPQHSQLSDIIK
jgi:hypothetical protein